MHARPCEHCRGKEPNRLACLKRPNHEEHWRMPNAPAAGEKQGSHTGGVKLQETGERVSPPTEFLTNDDPDLTDCKKHEVASHRPLRDLRTTGGIGDEGHTREHGGLGNGR